MPGPLPSGSDLPGLGLNFREFPLCEVEPINAPHSYRSREGPNVGGYRPGNAKDLRVQILESTTLRASCCISSTRYLVRL
jgi:hypothetical protein